MTWWCDNDGRWTWVNVMYADGIAAIAIHNADDLEWAIWRLMRVANP